MSPERWFFYVYAGKPTNGVPCGNQCLASGCAPNRGQAEGEGTRYLMQYLQDGPAFLWIRRAPKRKAARS